MSDLSEALGYALVAVQAGKNPHWHEEARRSWRGFLRGSVTQPEHIERCTFIIVAQRVEARQRWTGCS